MTEYTLKPLTSKDIFPMFKIISAIGIKEFKGCFESDEVKRMISNTTKDGNKPNENDVTAVGAAIVFDIAGIIIERIPACEHDIYTFLGGLSGMSRKELENMPLADFMQMIVDVIKKEEFKDFIGVVSKLFK